MPKVRRVQGLRAIAAARKALAHHRRNREWRREKSQTVGRDRAWFLREVVPKLDAFSLAEIAKVTGLSLAACSRFRAGTRVPHPRHWEAFLVLVKD